MNSGSKRLLVTGGGTGGHIYPALAIVKGWQEQGLGSVLYVGTRKGLEADIVPKAGIDFQTVTVSGLPRKLSLDLLRFGGNLVKGVLEALKIIDDFKPHVVLGTGGYVCGPVVVAAAMRKLPIVLHEQNAFPGITNKMLARFAQKIALTFKEAEQYFPQQVDKVLTGLPIRMEVLKAQREQAVKALGLDPNKLTLVITGGSQGAKSINQAMVSAYQGLDFDKWQVVHISGHKTYEETKLGLEKYKLSARQVNLIAYLYHMEQALAAADLILCRAGATTLAELTVRGIPAILVPYPFAAENHQEYNAKALVEAGAAHMILDKDLNAETVLLSLEACLQGNNLAQMAEASKSLGKPAALSKLLDLLSSF